MARLLIWILLAMVAYAVARNWSRRGADRVKSAGGKPAEAIVTSPLAHAAGVGPRG